VATAISIGNRVNYTPSSAVSLGAVVVVGQLVGVADRPIPANTLGALAVSGIFGMPKATGTGSALSLGAKVYWDATNSVVTATVGSNVYVGKVVKAAVDADASVEVIVNP
jgi:predicted RecA/RadA family phage recombinase